jgi:serine/threonine-protein kinase
MTGEQLGRYELIRELGRGGMAVVYLARDPHMKRQVAIKVLPRHFAFDPEFRARFLRESEAIVALEHPSIVPVYDYGEIDDQLYLVMRYMPGGSLADRMAKGSLPLKDIAAIFNRVGSALDAAHKSGMVHRDLKPSNILFDQWGEAHLSDFGIVKLAEGNSGFTSHMMVGTPAYMSPEQASGKGEVDGRSDVYSLAVILFQLLTNQLPFKADTPMGQAVAHIVEPVPNILKVNASLSPESDAVMRLALAKDPNERYQTAGALAEDVGHLASGTPTLTATRRPDAASRKALKSKTLPTAAARLMELKGNVMRPTMARLSVVLGVLALSISLCFSTVAAASQFWNTAKADGANSSNAPLTGDLSINAVNLDPRASASPTPQSVKAIQSPTPRPRITAVPTSTASSVPPTRPPFVPSATAVQVTGGGNNNSGSGGQPPSSVTNVPQPQPPATQPPPPSGVSPTPTKSSVGAAPTETKPASSAPTATAVPPTARPPTNTPVPPPTNTPVPPTNTPIPPPTATEWPTDPPEPPCGGGTGRICP